MFRLVEGTEHLGNLFLMPPLDPPPPQMEREKFLTETWSEGIPCGYSFEQLSYPEKEVVPTVGLCWTGSRRGLPKFPHVMEC